MSATTDAILRELDSAVLNAGLERRAHERRCARCARRTDPCETGSRLIRAYFDARRALERARRELAS